jgi:hypothetical protein
VIDLTERARRYIDTLPVGVSGQNRHAATFHCAFILTQGFGLSEDQAWLLLCEYNSRCLPPSAEHKLRYRLERALRASSSKERGFLARGAIWTPSKEYQRLHLSPPKKFEFNPEKLAQFAGRFATEADETWLAERSRASEELSGIAPQRFLELLYNKEREKVLIFRDWRSQGDFTWPDAADDLPAAGPDGIWFLNQPVDGDYHPNPRIGKMSRRSEESVTSWRYLVLESDKANPRHWLGALVQLPVRVAAIYTSGGRSIHALVRLDAQSKTEFDSIVEKMEWFLIQIGADIAALSAVRLTRLPGCYRRNKLQKLLYINPKPDTRPISQLYPIHQLKKKD